MLSVFLFHFSAVIVLPFWIAMIAFPRSSITARMVASPWIILPPILCYLFFGMPHMDALAGVFAAPSPESLAAVMGEEWAASMFWAYAGAFDLFVGRWMFHDAKEREINPWLVSPALFVAIFFGPVGFSLYGIIVGARQLSGRGAGGAPSK